MTTLPLQGAVDGFLRMLFPARKTEAFHLIPLTERVIEKFGVSEEDAFLKYDRTHGQTSSETTRIEQLTNWGCVHLLLDGTVKRTGTNEYQHVSGPKTEYKNARLPRKLVGEAMASVKILKNLNWEPERVMLELHQWSDPVIEAAIQRVWATPT